MATEALATVIEEVSEFVTYEDVADNKDASWALWVASANTLAEADAINLVTSDPDANDVVAELKLWVVR